MKDLNYLFTGHAYGINPQLVIRIAWSFDAPETTGVLAYAMDEMESLDPEAPIYGYVKEFSNLSLVSHTEGFGEVNSIQIVMFDAFGHFKKKFESELIFNLLATISIRTVADAEETELFEGIIEEPVWTQEGKEFSFSVVSKAIKGKLGYTPNIDDIDSGDPNYNFYKSILNTETWPNVFGEVEKLEAVRLNNISKTGPKVKPAEGEAVVVGSSSAYITEFTGNIPLDGDYTTEYGEDIVEGYIFNKDMIIPIKGTFNASNFVIATAGDLGFLLWEGSIAIEWGSIFTGAPTVLASDPGIPLQGMQLTVTIAAPAHTQGGYPASAYSFLFGFKVEHQDGLNLRLSTESHMEYFSNPEFETSHLTAVHLWNRNESNFIAGAWGAFFIIPPGASLYIKGRDKYDVYIVDTKPDTTVSKVQIERENDTYETLKEIVDGVGDYSVENTADDGTFWTESDTADAHPECTFINMGDNTFFKYFQNFLADNVIETESILVDCTSTSGTEQQVLTYLANLIGLTAVFHNAYGDSSQINKVLSWATTDEEDVPSILGEIAWQGMKGLRRSGDNLDVFDLQQQLPRIQSLGLDQIQFNSLVIMPSDYSEIITKITLNYNLVDLTADIGESIHRHNEDLYDTLEDEMDVYIFREKSDVITAGNYWIGRYSDPEYMIKITGSLDLMKYEAWDCFGILLPTHHFAKESPLLHTHTVADSPWVFEPLSGGSLVIVKEVSVNFNDMSVTLLLRTTKAVGTL